MEKIIEGNINKILSLNQGIKNNYYINDFEPYRNCWVLLNDNFATLPICKIGCTTIFAQAFIYSGKDNLFEFDKIKNKHAYKVYPSYFYETQKLYIDEETISQKKIILFREPKSRLISAWKNIFNDCTFDEFVINVSRTFRNYNINNIDQHINLQSNHYYFNNIDIFIELKDYPHFCREKGIPWIALNQTSYTNNIEVSEFTESLIKDIYAKDYELIERIKSSEKLWTY